MITSVRIAGCFLPSEALADVPEHALRLGAGFSSSPPSSAARVSPARRVRPTSFARRLISTAPSAKQIASAANGIAAPATNRNAPIGGAMSWLTPRKARTSGVGGREVLARYEPRQEGALGDIRERLAGAEQEQRHEDQGDAHDAGRDGHGEDGEDEGPSQVEDDRDHPPVEPVGGRPPRC